MASFGREELAFEAAASVSRELRNVSTGAQLELYGLFKHVRQGECDKPRPSAWDMAGVAKWRSWTARSGLAREDAMRQYCALVRSLSLSPADGDDRTSPCEDDETGFAPDEPVRRAFGAKSVSTLALGDSELGPAPQPCELLDATCAGELGRVSAALAAPDCDVHDCDDEGRNVRTASLSALHWAADRGFVDVCRRLMAAGVDVDARDAAGLTPLLYAVTCDHADVVRALLDAGADPAIADNDGDTPLSVASQSIRPLLLESPAILAAPTA